VKATEATATRFCCLLSLLALALQAARTRYTATIGVPSGNGIDRSWRCRGAPGASNYSGYPNHGATDRIIRTIMLPTARIVRAPAPLASPNFTSKDPESVRPCTQANVVVILADRRRHGSPGPVHPKARAVHGPLRSISESCRSYVHLAAVQVSARVASDMRLYLKPRPAGQGYDP
jgi:hypothetical protein